MHPHFIALAGKPKGKRPLGRPRDRWEDDNNRMDLKGVELDRTDSG